MSASPSASRAPDYGALAVAGASIAIASVAGFGLGLLALYLLGRLRLRFTWALLGAPLAYIAWLAYWPAGLAAAVAIATAAGIGAHRHLEAIHHGGEEARRRREARGPLSLARSQLALRSARQRRLAEGRLALGAAREGGVCRVPFGADRGVHALISGATGAGKTVTQAAILEAYVGAGQGAVVVDPKGDGYLRETAAGAARSAGVRFLEWTPAGPALYNPLARGGPTEVAEKALAAHRFSEPHYELATRRLLGHVLATMQAAQVWPPTLSAVVNYMDPNRLELLAGELDESHMERVLGYLDSLSARGKADAGGGRDRLAVLVNSELGPWLDPCLGKGERIDLEVSLRQGDVLYFNLDADRYPGAARLLAAALVIDLVGLAAERQGEAARSLVVVNEFAALAAEQVSRLFARARSAGLSLLLGTQSLADLRGARPEDGTDTLTEQVLSNIEFAVVHRVGDPDSAERFARMAGTLPAWTVTQRVSGAGAMLSSGEGTRTREREFVILPDRFKRLGVGEAVVIDPAAKPHAQVVRIWPPGE